MLVVFERCGRTKIDIDHATRGAGIRGFRLRNREHHGRDVCTVHKRIVEGVELGSDL